MTQVLIKIAVTVVFSFLGFYAYLVFSRRRVVERAVREETGERHAAKKRIPDMAGIVMLVCYAILVPVLFPRFRQEEWSNVLYYVPLIFGFLGLTDDFVKNFSKNTKGIPARYRIILQFILAMLTLHMAQGLILIDNPLLIVVFVLATVNAANFTDGLDGLLAGSAIIPLIGFLIIFISYDLALWEDLDCLGQLLVFICILAVFLIFNRHPAKMFMGDGGSMFIGAFLAILAFEFDQMILFLVMGFVIYFELLSVVLQVISFKLFKKRIFPMTPFHHSFEKWGWKEPQIVLLFYGASLVFTALGVYLEPHMIIFY